MIKTAFKLSLALSTFMALPALGAEQFQCPLFSNPNNPAKLEQIRGLLPNVNTMTNIEQLTATIATLRREGMSKSLIIEHLVGAYCPMLRKPLLFNASQVKSQGWFTASKAAWTLSLTCRSRPTSSTL